MTKLSGLPADIRGIIMDAVFGINTKTSRKHYYQNFNIANRSDIDNLFVFTILADISKNSRRVIAECVDVLENDIQSCPSRSRGINFRLNEEESKIAIKSIIVRNLCFSKGVSHLIHVRNVSLINVMVSDLTPLKDVESLSVSYTNMNEKVRISTSSIETDAVKCPQIFNNKNIQFCNCVFDDGNCLSVVSGDVNLNNVNIRKMEDPFTCERAVLTTSEIPFTNLLSKVKVLLHVSDVKFTDYNKTVNKKQFECKYLTWRRTNFLLDGVVDSCEELNFIECDTLDVNVRYASATTVQIDGSDKIRGIHAMKALQTFIAPNIDLTTTKGPNISKYVITRANGTKIPIPIDQLTELTILECSKVNVTSLKDAKNLRSLQVMNCEAIYGLENLTQINKLICGLENYVLDTRRSTQIRNAANQLKESCDHTIDVIIDDIYKVEGQGHQTPHANKLFREVIDREYDD
jgi:hypothetical protein